jgi:hypothetical protein
MRPSLLALLLVLASPNVVAQDGSQPPVKKSRSGICHERGYGSYNQTKQFESYDSMDACVSAGGRRAENVPTLEERARQTANDGSSGWLKKGGFIAGLLALMGVLLRGPIRQWLRRRQQSPS